MPETPPDPVRQQRILLAEHDSFLRAALIFDLETDGFEVRGFGDAAEALASWAPADCLVVELNLPDLDGLTLIGRLRDLGVDAPAILLVTQLDRRRRAAATAAGVEIVEKPLIGDALRRRIGALIGL